MQIDIYESPVSPVNLWSSCSFIVTTNALKSIWKCVHRFAVCQSYNAEYPAGNSGTTPQNRIRPSG